MPFERPRARRYPFAATIELTDLESERQSWELTSELSLFGCYVNALVPLPARTKVRIRIVRAGANFVALGRVVYAQEGAGMGVVFTEIEPSYQSVLENWLTELRDKHP